MRRQAVAACLVAGEGGGVEEDDVESGGGGVGGGGRPARSRADDEDVGALGDLARHSTSMWPPGTLATRAHRLGSAE